MAKLRDCQECKRHRFTGESQLVCLAGHKPKWRNPTDAQAYGRCDRPWGYVRKCDDFKSIDTTPEEA